MKIEVTKERFPEHGLMKSSPEIVAKEFDCEVH